MTPEQFEQNFEFRPKLDRNVSFSIWNNNTTVRTPKSIPSGRELFRLELLNPPKTLKNIHFYKTKKWNEIEPELIKLFYELYILIYEKLIPDELTD